MYMCEGDIPVIEGERLRLRPLRTSDAKRVFEIWGNPDVSRYLNLPPFASVTEIRQMISFLNILAESEETLRWGIELKDREEAGTIDEVLVIKGAEAIANAEAEQGDCTGVDGVNETDERRTESDDQETGWLIGTCGFNSWELSGASRGEIGYDLDKPFWGCGYMSEALRLMLSFGFHTMGLNRIEALVHPDNLSSRKLLQSFRFTEEGLLRQYQKSDSGYMDLLMYSLLKEEF